MSDIMIMISVLLLFGFIFAYAAFVFIKFVDTLIGVKNKKEFLRLLSEGAKNNTLDKDWSELERLFEIAYGFALGEKDAKKMKRNLGEFYKLVIANQLELSNEKNLEWKSAIIAFLKEAEGRNPYEQLPFEERSALQNIEKFLTGKTHDEAKKELKILSNLMIAKEREMLKHAKKNKWVSIVLAAIGIILTVIFGLLSLFGS